MDGCCRHVVATLLELQDFQDDIQKKCVTSGICQWKSRQSKISQFVLADELKTFIVAEEKKQVPSIDTYQPSSLKLPNEEQAYNIIKEELSNACILDCHQVNSSGSVSQSNPTCLLPTPLDKLEDFLETSDCTLCENCCDQICAALEYTSKERNDIEITSRGQHNNPNWHRMRKGLLTSSSFKQIHSCRNSDNTASSLLHGSSLDENHLPKHVE